MNHGVRPFAAGLLLLPMLSLSACVGYIRFRVDEPIAETALQQLQPGQELGACLALLGAPNQVFEYRGNGMALLWVWRDTDDWSVNLNLPLQDQVSASFELDLTDSALPGCVLWFGEDLRLERWRSGTLGELVPSRVRPSAVEPAGG